EQPVHGDADHDRRDAVQDVRGVAHGERQRTAPVLREIHAAEEPDRHTDRGSEEQELAASDERVRHAAARLADRRRQLREEVPRQRARALPDEVAEQEEEDAEHGRRRGDGQREHDALDEAATPVAAAHARTSSPPRTPRIIRRATAFTTSVMPKSTRPTSTSAARWMSDVASANSLASTAA